MEKLVKSIKKSLVEDELFHCIAFNRAKMNIYKVEPDEFVIILFIVLKFYHNSMWNFCDITFKKANNKFF